MKAINVEKLETIRVDHILIDASNGEEKACDSIGEAKRKSRAMQTHGLGRGQVVVAGDMKQARAIIDGMNEPEVPIVHDVMVKLPGQVHEVQFDCVIYYGEKNDT